MPAHGGKKELRNQNEENVGKVQETLVWVWVDVIEMSKSKVRAD